ncbi:MAG: protein-L-isoaspartate O-methyltransferase [Pseudomonadota bacterium]
MNTEHARRQMLMQQLRTWEVLDPDVLTTFESVPREHFAPPAYARLAFADAEIPLGHGQVMLRPSVEGRLVQTLDLRADDEVLEIGAGSGFVTACLARLAGKVHSLEYYEPLAEMAVHNLCEAGVTNAEVRQEDATQLATPGQYDAVLVSAAVAEAAGEQRFREALKVGGRLVLISGREPVMEACLIRRVSALEWTRTAIFETAVPALIDAAARPPFEF